MRKNFQHKTGKNWTVTQHHDSKLASFVICIDIILLEKKNISWARWGEEEEETKGSKQTPTTLPSLKTNIYVEHFGTRPLIDEGLVPKRRKLDTSAGVYLKL